MFSWMLVLLVIYWKWSNIQFCCCLHFSLTPISHISDSWPFWCYISVLEYFLPSSPPFRPCINYLLLYAKPLQNNTIHLAQDSVGWLFWLGSPSGVLLYSAGLTDGSAGADSSQMASAETVHVLKNVVSFPSVIGLAGGYSWQLDMFQESGQKHARHLKA